MVDDGYGNFGGGGSIHWEVDVNDGDPIKKSDKAVGKPREYKVNGVDRQNVDDTTRYFRVTIENRATVLMSFDGDDLVLGIPVRKNEKNKPRQIQVQWAYERGELPDALGPVPRRAAQP